MLHVVTGRFHPHLEAALVDHISRAKAADPFAALAVLVPSQPLVERLAHLLAVEHRLSLLNVHLLTFHQLALRLAAEAGDRAAVPDVVDDLFFEQLVRHLVRSRLTAVAPLQQIGHSSGTWAALWSTVRDLKDGGVDPAAALRAVEEDCFGRDDRAWLTALFSLHAAVQEAGKVLTAGTADDLAAAITPFVPHSGWIRGVGHVFYYGFYDLTQVQLSLLEAVAKTAPTTLFFPLDDGPSFRFARRFFDRAIQPLVPSTDHVVHLAGSPVSTAPAPRTPSLTVRSVVGAEEEVAATCRQILDLVETNGYRFDDIGVVARSLEAYRTVLPPVFDRHRIPLVTRIGLPLVQEPLCKTLLQLAALPLHEYYRAAVLDIVTSPLYRSRHCDQAPPAHVRPDLWKLLVPALHITRGAEEWTRLEKAGHAALAIDGDDEPEHIGPIAVPPEVIRLLWLMVSELLEDTAAWPAQGTVAQLAASFQQTLDRHLFRPDEADGSEDGHAALVRQGLDRVFRTLAQLDAIGDRITWQEFVDLLTHVLERTTVPPAPDSHRGVAVLDAMAARGLPFKALFLLGLNDTVFPRYIREDPFLRDRHRRVLDDTLGFKIDEKLAGYEEEALLLTLMQQAAADRLILSYQRADEQGRQLTASPAVAAAARLCGLDDVAIESVPRRLTDRVAQRPLVRNFLPPDDLALWLTLAGRDAAPLLEAVGRNADSFRRGREALERLEHDRFVLSACDGITGELADHWSRLEQRGLAPTPLERYAHCPFQYFAAEVLRLEPVRQPLAPEWDPALIGTVCHAALRRCYEQLIPMGWPAKPVTDDTVEWCVYTAVAQAAEEHEARYRTGHYLLWELAKDLIVELIAAAVEADEAAYAEEPFLPVAFEVEAEGRLPPLADGDAPLKIRGRVDRIDRHRDGERLRVIDYKFKIGSSGKPEDRNLVQAAARGLRLQPPLYACLDLPPGDRKPAEVQLVFLAPHWPTPIARATFESAVWSSAPGARVRDTIRLLLEGIRAGRFFILPDSYCDRCEFRVACRRDHTPTWWRAYRAAEPHRLRALRALTIKDA